MKFDCDGDKAWAILPVAEGTHYLTLIKRTFYDTPLCYLNILNPIFYLWQIRFSWRWNAGYDMGYASSEVSFELSEEGTPSLQISLVEHEIDEHSSYYTFSCKSNGALKILRDAKKMMSSVMVKRFRLTHIMSAAFYWLLLNFLCILDCIQGDTSVTAAGLFFLLSTAFSSGIAYRSAKLKSVYDTIKRKNKSKKER